MKKSHIIFIITFIIFFIIVYYLFIILFYVVPKGYDFPIIVSIGFALIIVGFFYFFIKLVDSDNKIYTFNYKGLTETSLKVILLILMLITYFIPPVNFSDISIDWNQISFLNYIRGIIFLIGCTFIPGSCIFNIFFPKSTLHEKINIEPFFIKIVFYPLLSLTLLGSITLFIDQIGLKRGNFSIVLFTVIIILFFVDVLFQKHYKKKFRLFNRKEIKISKFTIFILLIALSIIVLSFGIQTKVKYILYADSYKALNYYNFIGRLDTPRSVFFPNYAIYWSCISFGLTTLTGIPGVNINVLMFPFIYLFILSLYLFFKAFLKEVKEKYAILATIIAITFSSLFNIFQSYAPYQNVSWFVFSGLLNFQYKGFALILFIASMTLFISIIKNQKLLEINKYSKFETLFIITLSAFFLLQSIMIYFLPSIPAISLIILLIIFAKEKEIVIKYYLLFVILLIVFFLFFDIITTFFFSSQIIMFSNSFFKLNLPFQKSTRSFRILFNATLMYLFLIGFLIVSILINKVYKKNYFKNVKAIKRFSLNSKYAFLIILIIFTEFLILDIIFNFFGNLHKKLYPALILHSFFLNLGILGILGLYLSYYSFKKKRYIFYISLIWFMFLFSLSVIELFFNWYQYPSAGPITLTDQEYLLLSYWFTRVWYYSIIPISIFCSIGLIKLKKYLGSKFQKKKLKNYLTLPLKLLFVSTFIVSAISNTITSGIWYYNSNYSVNDEEAQVIGWIAKNTPQNSNILIDRLLLYNRIRDLTNRSSYLIDYEIEQAFMNYNAMNVTKEIDDNCSVELLNEKNGHKHVIEFLDQNNNGSGTVLIKTNSSQQFGEIKFNIKISNTSKIFWINLTSPENITVISFGSYSYSFHLYNGSTYQKLMDIENNVWYQVKLIFECTDGNYSGLGKYKWKILINGTKFGEFSFLNKKLVENFYLYTSKKHSEYAVYVSEFNFSWMPSVKIEYYIFSYLILIDHLKDNNISYFLLYEEETEENKIEKSSIDIKGDLIPKFYKSKLYEYKNLVLYSTE